jgi:uncharacterized protein
MLSKVRFFLLVLLFCIFYNSGMAQPNPEKHILRQRNYFTLEEAKLEHKNLALSYLTKKDWEKRAELIKKGIRNGAELPLFKGGKKVKATIHSKKILDGYSVENVFFESISGLFVSGNLYKPLNYSGKIPAVLAPHGHGKNPRFGEATQQRCASMARMGAVVFAFDMIGYGDMQQCDHTIEKALKLQIIQSIRSLDFLSQLPYVDVSKIAVSGESGGGTQTFILAALDDRVKVSVPVVMVSGYFFGGCVCESGMPIHVRETHKTTNVEIAACAAPRPLLLVSDGDDWTKNNPEFEYPYIRRIYDLFQAGNQVENIHLPNEKHDYGPSKRAAAYKFLAKHLDLDFTQADESRNKLLEEKDLSVFNESNPRPSNAILGNQEVLKQINKIK